MDPPTDASCDTPVSGLNPTPAEDDLEGARCSVANPTDEDGDEDDAQVNSKLYSLNY